MADEQQASRTHVTYLGTINGCRCSLLLEPSVTTPGTHDFIKFVDICADHAAVVAADPEDAYRNVVGREMIDFSQARQAIIDAELDKTWPGTNQAFVDSEQARLAEVIITTREDLDALDLNTVQMDRVIELEGSAYTVGGVVPNRTGKFDVVKQTATNAELDAAIVARTGKSLVTTETKVTSG